MNGHQIGTAAASLEASYEFYFGKRKPMPMHSAYTISAYRQRVDAANLAAQAPTVKAVAGLIIKQLRDIETRLYWSIDPEEDDGGASWAKSLIENAHALLDLAHEYKAELKANPPPRVESADAQE